MAAAEEQGGEPWMEGLQGPNRGEDSGEGVEQRAGPGWAGSGGDETSSDAEDAGSAGGEGSETGTEHRTSTAQKGIWRQS